MYKYTDFLLWIFQGGNSFEKFLNEWRRFLYKYSNGNRWQFRNVFKLWQLIFRAQLTYLMFKGASNVIPEIIQQDLVGAVAMQYTGQ